MLKFITDFLDAKHKRKLEEARAAMKPIELAIKLTQTMAEVQIAKFKNKCYSCEHSYKKKIFEKGGIIPEQGGEIIIPLKGEMVRSNGAGCQICMLSPCVCAKRTRTGFFKK